MGQGCASGSWKRLNFCGSGSTLKKEARSGSKLGSDYLYSELEAEAKIFYCFHISGFNINRSFKNEWKQQLY